MTALSRGQKQVVHQRPNSRKVQDVVRLQPGKGQEPLSQRTPKSILSCFANKVRLAYIHYARQNYVSAKFNPGAARDSLSEVWTIHWGNVGRIKRTSICEEIDGIDVGVRFAAELNLAGRKRHLVPQTQG
jgi:hypothetical protein